MNRIHATAVLERLRADFPLEQRLRKSPEAVRTAYLEVLEHWHQNGRPPEALGLDGDTIAQLAALDAVAHQAQGLGCYPYSAGPGDITVTRPDGGSVVAMCALDALAVPMLERTDSRIEAACSHCGKALALQSAPGGVAGNNTIAVHYRPRRARHTPCCTSLCDGITFVCGKCAPARHPDYLRLVEADAVARQFFAFQRAWLDARPGSAGGHESALTSNGGQRFGNNSPRMRG
ncbi:organomercurial lyase [Thioalkalivibrio sp.]|uniref:organomercurial lyase n=1 Tax=Thioalkalivibrio sp. TaxID=2093813 RepID=UPI003561F380